MASIISAGTSSGTALNLTGDTSGILQLASNNGTVGLTLDTAQNLGVGTTTPLAAAGNTSVSINGSTAGRVDLYAAGTRQAYFYADASGAQLSTVNALPLLFQTTNAERMRISATGNVGINNTTPSYKLDVSNTGASNVPAIRILGNDQGNVRLRFDNTGTQVFELVGGTPGASNSGFAVYDVTNAATRLQISSVGQINMPSQPAFLATGAAVTSATNTVLWGTNGGSVVLNVGSSYSSGTGRFTAPVAGNYLFCVSGLCNSGSYFTGNLAKNGSQYCAWRTTDTGTGLNYAQATVTIVMPLAVNDYVSATITGGTMQGGANEIFFAGHLVS